MLMPQEGGAGGEVTALLRAWRAGDEEAFGQLAPLLYVELKKIARQYMTRERKDHTLQPTALVNEAFLRLIQTQGLEVHDRVHFVALAARMMRRILVSHARHRQRGKRGGGAKAIPLEDDLASTPPARNEEILELNRALEELTRVDARKAQMVELHFFGGLGFEEIAAVLELSERTIRRDWVFVKAWLAREMRPATGE